MIYVEVKEGEYTGWRGYFVRILRKGKISADNVVEVAIAQPPEFGICTRKLGLFS